MTESAKLLATDPPKISSSTQPGTTPSQPGEWGCDESLAQATSAQPLSPRLLGSLFLGFQWGCISSSKSLYIPWDPKYIQLLLTWGANKRWSSTHYVSSTGPHARNIQANKTQMLPLDLMVQEETDEEQATTRQCETRSWGRTHRHRGETRIRESFLEHMISELAQGLWRKPEESSKEATQEGTAMVQGWQSGRPSHRLSTVPWACRRERVRGESSEEGRAVSGSRPQCQHRGRRIEHWEH